MLKVLLKVFIFIFLCAVAIEQTYRVYAAGSVAFQPVRFNSLNMLPRTGFVEESPFPGISYQLKPDQDGWHQTVPFKTNSAGLADKEYAKVKPDDAFRVAVVGSSWSMATHVQQEDSYHSILEDELTSQSDSMNYEFINFAVEYFGLKDIVNTVRYRVMEWNPDVIVVGITTYTASLRWQETAVKAELPEQSYPIFESYALRALDSALGTGWYSRGLANRPVLKTLSDGTYLAQVERTVDEVHQIAAEAGVPVVVLWLSYGNPGKEIEALMQAKSEDLGVVYIKGYKELSLGSGREGVFYARRFDKHPNRSGHLRLASRLLSDMQESNLLPETFKMIELQPVD